MKQEGAHATLTNMLIAFTTQEFPVFSLSKYFIQRWKMPCMTSLKFRLCYRVGKSEAKVNTNVKIKVFTCALDLVLDDDHLSAITQY